MKHFVTASILFLAVFSGQAQGSLLKQAEEAKRNGDYQQSYDLYKQASDIFIGQSAVLSYIETHLEMIDCQLLNGNPFLAKSLAENTLEYVESELESTSSLKARTYTLLGLSFLNLGRNDDALESLQEAEKLFGTDDSAEKANCFNALGLAYGTINSDILSTQYHEKALGLRRRILGKDAEEVGDSFNNLGLLYTVDQPLQALVYYNRAKAIYEKKLGENHQKTLRLDVNMAFANLALENYEVALEIVNKVKEIYDADFSGDNQHKAFILSIIGRVHEGKKDLDVALSYQQQALEMYLSLFGEKHPAVANTYFLIGSIHQNNGEFKLAVQFYQQSIYSNFANTNSEGLYDLPVLEDYFDADILLSSLQAKAKALEALHFEKTLNTKDLTGAIDTYKLCDELISIIRRQRLDEKDKLKLGEISKDVYENGIKLSLILSEQSFKRKFYLETAFEFCERSKSSVLLEAITETKAKQFSGIPTTLLSLEDSLKDEISYIEQKLAEPDNEEDEALKDLLFLYQNEYRSFITKLESDYPDYYNLKYSSNLSGVSEVQAKLNDQTALLSYFIGKDEIYIFTVTKKGIRAVTKPKDDSFEKSAKSIRNAIKYNVVTTFINSSKNLYDHLIPQLSSSIKELVILPDGVLGTLPFEALIDSDSESSDYDSAPFLIRNYGVSYDYSATLFTQRKTEEVDSSSDILLFAPVDFSENEVKMATLPGSEEEIMEIRYLFMGTSNRPETRTRLQASESSLKLEDLNKYKFLHFATHGLVNESEPALSRIFLNPSEGEDGSLYAGEIYNLKIDADLVTLSACETGLGKVAKGEGIVGLSRALQYAGANNIIVSLWQVSDASTSQMMIEFYKYNLNNDHHGYNAALRQAKLMLLNTTEYNSPYYWAPFILVGM
ncbi:MAG: CHAT domain-containing tetratricopeptide repeat protein [Cyclobacteriaceae bacterium]